MKKSILILIGLLNLAVCRGQSDYVILKDLSTVHELIYTYQILPKSTATTELSEAEFNLAMKISLKFIKDYNIKVSEDFKKRKESKRYAKMYQIRDLNNYKIQYVPYLNEKGEKEIWINGFCDSFNKNWKKEIIHVFDGGNCYFTLQLNLSTGECISVGTNGYA